MTYQQPPSKAPIRIVLVSHPHASTRNPETNIANQIPRRSRHHHRPRSRSRRHHRRHVRITDHAKLRGRNAVEGHASCAGQSLAEDLSSLADLARRKGKRDERTKTSIEAINSAGTVAAVACVCSVKLSIGCLDYSVSVVPPEASAFHSVESSGRRHAVDQSVATGATSHGCPVRISIASQSQP